MKEPKALLRKQQHNERAVQAEVAGGPGVSVRGGAA